MADPRGELNALVDDVGDPVGTGRGIGFWDVFSDIVGAAGNIVGNLTRPKAEGQVVFLPQSGLDKNIIMLAAVAVFGLIIWKLMK